MPEERTTRRLAAILAADVVGYSRMMGGDEAGTHAALRRHREAVFDPAVAANNGRIVKLIGDGTLVEFASVVDAVNCALAIQRAVKTGRQPDRNHAPHRRQSRRRHHRRRRHLRRRRQRRRAAGAAGRARRHLRRLDRQRKRRQPHRREHSRTAARSRSRTSTGRSASGNGTPEAEPVRERARQTGARGKAGQAVDRGAAVQQHVGRPEQEYFSDGITEDIITDLSKVGGLLVIARNSSFAYKGKSVDIRTVGRELGVTSVLEGSIRRAGNRVRITAQLIDAATGGHVWADRYDRDLTDIFAVQDEVTERIVAALRVTLTPTEKARIAGGGTTNLEAHDLFMRGREIAIAPTKNRETFEQAVALFGRAVELDPDYSDAYAALAMTYNLDFHNRWTENPDKSLDIAARLADQAVEKGPNEPFGHYVQSVIASFKNDLARATAESEKALAINPNYAQAHSSRGIIDIYAGNPLAGIPRIERSMRLDPAFAQQYLHFVGLAYLTAGKYEAAAAQFKERIALSPQTDLSRAFLASTLGHLGQIDEARRVWRELKEINPKYSFDDHIGRLPFQKAEDVARIREGLTKAGLPD